MKILPVSVMSLSLVVGSQIWAQSPGQAPAPLSISNRERVELCKKKRNVPLEPSETQPLHVEDSGGKVTRPTIIHQAKPRFTGSAGTVVVEAVIDEDGCVRQTRVVQSASRSQDAPRWSIPSSSGCSCRPPRTATP